MMHVKPADDQFTSEHAVGQIIKRQLAADSCADTILIYSYISAMNAPRVPRRASETSHQYPVAHLAPEISLSTQRARSTLLLNQSTIQNRSVALLRASAFCTRCSSLSDWSVCSPVYICVLTPALRGPSRTSPHEDKCAALSSR